MREIRHGFPEREYRALPGLSGTEVATILDNPADLAWKRANPWPSTSAMALGTLTHSLILGVESENVIASEFPNYLTKAAKDWKAEQVAAGMTIVTWADYRKADALAAAIRANPLACGLFEQDGHAEVTVTDEHKGAALKGRIDYLPATGPIVDLKTSRDASMGKFEAALGAYGIPTQMAHYALLAGREAHRPLIVVVQTTGRPAVRVYKLGELTWAVALEATRRAWDVYAECVRTGEWPDVNASEIRDIDLKPWALDELEGIEEIEAGQ